ncbi:MAG: CRTAC1 family protein [Thermoanaerobaculia bacterium]|nr:CRTAC1 family protein [Thermoanaerobaculia bacterium]
MARRALNALWFAPIVSGLTTIAAVGVADGESSSHHEAPTIRFVEVGRDAGADIVHSNRSFGDRHKADILEVFTDGGAVVAVGDVDNDGDDDLFFVESAEGAPNHLLLNEGVASGSTGDGIPRFREVTRQAGIGGGNDADAICSEALFLDYDADGRMDLLVGRFGAPMLWRQTDVEDGIPVFQEVSKQVGLTRHGNTITAIAFDADGDGWLDLVLGHYFREELNLLRLDTTHVLPNNLDYADNGGGVTFWLNRPAPKGADVPGGRVFVQSGAGMAHVNGWTLDLGHSDLDLDGDQDLYVAGDFGTDRLFLGHGDGTFLDVTEQAIGWDTRKGMNAEVGDFDGDLLPDVYVTNITDDYMKECNMLWQNQGLRDDGTGRQIPWFLDVSRETGTCDTDWGWGAKFADFDNDGELDLIATNGMRSGSEENYIPALLENVVLNPEVDFSDLDSYPDLGDATWSGYQRNRLFRNQGDGTFQDLAEAAGVDNDLDGRGLALGDFDLDGRLDLVQASAGEAALLYLNRSEHTGRWLGLRLRGRGPNREAIGARILITASNSTGERTWVREIDGGNGYAAASTRRVHFGLGHVEAVTRIEIRWPSGRVETIRPREGEPGLPMDRYLAVDEGEGIR